VRFALYATIWVALSLFVIAEAGKVRRATHRSPAWAWPAFAAGAVLAAIHVLIALAVQYEWDHEAAVSSTAEQAATVYGFMWRGSIYVSYVFVLLWLVEAVRWRLNPAMYSARAPLTTWVLRFFVLLIIVNGAIVFATYPMRLLGVVIAGALVWMWSADAIAARASAAPVRGSQG
jgi:hypothetical protein